MQLSDRIGIMYRGKLVAVVPGDKATKEYVGLLMAGVDPDKAGGTQGSHPQGRSDTVARGRLEQTQ